MSIIFYLIVESFTTVLTAFWTYFRRKTEEEYNENYLQFLAKNTLAVVDNDRWSQLSQNM